MGLFSVFQRFPDISKQLQQYNLPVEEIQAWSGLMKNAKDRELFQINPRYLAEKLGWGESKILDFLTVSVAENIWDLEWDAYCEACGHLMQSTAELGQLYSHQECEMCGAQSDLALDRAVAARASIHPGVRRLNKNSRDDLDFRSQLDERYGKVPSLHLINRPLFREILGEQILPPNQSLGVQQLAIFFSDLKRSTMLYQRLGDVKAYELVREHFNLIFNIVERHGGAAIKTIGDGVMGTFFDSVSALRGVTESVRAIEALNQEAGLSEEDALHLKVGLHVGGCIVVTLNGRLDYFGSTVNIAARLSDLAQGGEVILSKAVLEDPEARELAEKLLCDQERETALRGVTQKVEICRIRPTSD